MGELPFFMTTLKHFQDFAKIPFYKSQHGLSKNSVCFEFLLPQVLHAPITFT